MGKSATKSRRSSAIKPAQSPAGPPEYHPGLADWISMEGKGGFQLFHHGEDMMSTRKLLCSIRFEPNVPAEARERIMALIQNAPDLWRALRSAATEAATAALTAEGRGWEDFGKRQQLLKDAAGLEPFDLPEESPDDELYRSQMAAYEAAGK